MAAAGLGGWLAGEPPWLYYAEKVGAMAAGLGGGGAAPDKFSEVK